MPKDADYAFSSSIRNGVLVVSVGGRVHCANFGSFQDRFRARLGGYGGNVIVNLSEAVYLCTSFWALIMELSGTLEAQNGKMVIAVPEGLVKKILTVLGFHTKFEIYNSVDDALESF